jgi:His/Glu/Gln/Arg/opine family amino acid ABC transporter permease subunit
MSAVFQYLGDEFIKTFVTENRYQLFLSGLANTLIITFFAVLLGIVLGFTMAYIRTTHDRTGRLGVLDVFARLYLTVIRGTPTVVQLMIMYYLILASLPTEMSLLVAILAFGINSGAYVAEIFRSGIMSIDPGQMEAARSLGLSYQQATWKVILPQAVKNVLPALGNELITLLKETSISGYIAIRDLTKAADIVRSRTFSPLFPLLSLAAMYLIMVVGLEKLLGRMEARLAQSDR